MNDEILTFLPGALLPWYETGHRDLPWRQDREPYHIWLSEIMLQQTRVEAVKGYYHRFLQALPTIWDLAQAPQEQLNKLWEGLGYYSRVRNLKKAAQVICESYGGKFPETYAQVRALPGIGPYTAGAICSIAFNLPTAAVDGNVLRVVTRLTDDHTPSDLPAFRKDVESALSRVYPTDAGTFTQALMELGATVCGPNRAPQCGECPCRAFCLGKQRDTAAALPVRLPKKTRRQEDMTVLILRCGERYALCRREEKGLLAGLWEFPHVPGTLTVPQALEQAAKLGISVRGILRQTDKKHIFTHVQWNMRGIYLETNRETASYIWMTADEIQEKAALPTAFRQFWEEEKDV